MLIRYKTSTTGKPVKQAEIFTQEEHGIELFQLDSDALKIIRRLQDAGYEAYIVGGAVRDILLGKVPKDFDIATSAVPNQIRRLFRNSRIIGKRFRLVHVFFHNTKIIEVSTFRSGLDNSYGSIEDDVYRRDFSVNALYYDPDKAHLLDFVQGFADLRGGRLRAVIPLGKIFVEDSVRIVRAVKYMVKADLKPDFLLSQRIKRHSPLLQEVSSSRITEEIYKILDSGHAKAIFVELFNFTIMSYILPGLDKLLRADKKAAQRFFANLQDLDEITAQNAARTHSPVARPGIRTEFLYHLLHDYLINLAPWALTDTIDFAEIISHLKELLKPMIPPNKDLENATVALIQKRGQQVIHKKKRRRRPRRKPRPT